MTFRLRTLALGASILGASGAGRGDSTSGSALSCDAAPPLELVLAADPNPVAQLSPIVFTTAGSHDPRGGPALYTWRLEYGDGTSTAQQTPATTPDGVLMDVAQSHAYDWPGTHVVRYTVEVVSPRRVSCAVSTEVTVDPSPHAPVAADDGYGMARDTVLVVPAHEGVLANDADPEGGDLRLDVTSPPTHGTLDMNEADGSFTYTPKPGFIGADSFEYRALDSELLFSYAATVTLQVHPAVGSDTLVHWKLDETSGTTAMDSSGNDHHAVARVAEPSWTPGRMGGGLRFDGGAGRFVEGADAGAALEGLSSFTVTLWIKSDRTDTDRGFLTAKEPDGKDDVLSLRYDAAGFANGDKHKNLIKAGITTTGGIQQIESSSEVQTRGWQFVALSWANGEKLRLYINGRRDRPTFNSGPTKGVLTGATTLRIGQGAKDLDRTWDGLVDDVRVYARALSNDEVRGLYLESSDLLVHWRLDETSGTAATDSSGNGHDGLVQMARPSWVPGRMGGALSFDGGQGRYLQDRDAEDYLEGLSAFTSTMWIKSDRKGTDRGFLTAKEPNGKDDVLSLRYDAAGFANGDKHNNLIKAGITTTGGVQQIESSAGVQTQEWQFVALSWASGEPLRLYVNGRLDRPTFNSPPTSGLLTGTTTLRIGQGVKDLDRTWDGLVDDVRIYGRALSADEIARLAHPVDDHVPPVLTGLKLTADGGNAGAVHLDPAGPAFHYSGAASGHLTVSVSVSDAGSGLDAVSFDDVFSASDGAVRRLGGEAGPTTLTHSYAIVTARDVQGSFAARATDVAGNTDTTSWSVARDTAAPTVTVSAPALSPRSIEVSWSGSDAGAGVRHYDVEVRDLAQAAWTAWLTSTTAHQGTFLGAPAHRYRFRLRGVDNVGNTSGWRESGDVEVENLRPVAFGQSVTTTAGQPVTLRLAASDPEGQPLTWHLTSPSHGKLAGPPPDVVYTPDAGYQGEDAFTFKVGDGAAESATATVAITIEAPAGPPTALDQRVVTEVGKPVAFTLQGSDPEGDPLVFALVTHPQHGTLFGSEAQLLYTPEPGFQGFDSFTFKASDGRFDSNVARVTVVVGHPAVHTVVDLGTLGGPTSAGQSINALGQVVGGADAEAGRPRPFLITPRDTNGDGVPDRWFEAATSGRNALMTDLLPPSDSATGEASEVSEAGAVAGTSAGSAFLWSQGTLSSAFPGPGLGINRSGTLVGARTEPFEEAVAWFADTSQVLVLGNGQESRAEAVNSRGEIVGGIRGLPTVPGQPGLTHAFLYFDDDADRELDAGEQHLLDGGTIEESWAHDVNEAGVVAAAARIAGSPHRHAFLVSRSPAGGSFEWRDLGTLGGNESVAHALNGRGQVVGTSDKPARPGPATSRPASPPATNAANGAAAFLWKDGTLADLNGQIASGSGWNLLSANDVNDAGWIVGEGINPEGQRHGFLLLPNQPPSALLTADPPSGDAPLEVAFDGSGSSDPEDGKMLTYTWDFGDGETLAGPAAVPHVFQQPGTYTVRLTVADTWNAQSATEVTVSVSAAPPLPAPPKAVIVASPTAGAPPLAVTFDGTGSTSGVALTSYSWVFGDGQTSDGPQTAHTYSNPGSYQATLTVRDARDLSATASVVISVGSSGSGVWAWGWNGMGGLGDGTTEERHRPVRASGLSDVTAVAAGGGYSVALKADGTVWAWGWNIYGQLGDGTTTDRLTPAPVPNLSGIVAIDAGRYFSLALKNDGTVWQWGGVPEFGVVLSPVPVTGLSGVVAIDAGRFHALALTSDGQIWAWGDNSSGQFGDGSTISQGGPVRGPQQFQDVVAIAGGGYLSVALRADGTVWRWGANTHNLNDLSPVQLANLTGVTSIAAGELHALTRKADGAVWAWGYNYDGQLGIGAPFDFVTDEPLPISALSDVVAIAASDRVSLARRSDGTVWAWGRNANGQLGDGTTVFRTSPVQVSTLTGATDVEAGPDQSIAVTEGAPLNLPPTAAPTVTPADAAGNGLGYVDPAGTHTTTFQFAAHASDPNGDALTYAWDLDANGSVDCAAEACSFVYPATGTYLASLTVTDASGLTVKRAVQVNVHPHLPPRAVLTAVEDGLGVNLDGSQSEAVRGTPGRDGITVFEWILGDGATQASALPATTHTYLKPGTYTVSLRVTNSFGLVDQAQVTVHVDYPDDLFDRRGANDTRATADPLLPEPNVLEPGQGYSPAVETRTSLSYRNSGLVLKPLNEDWYQVDVPPGADYRLDVQALFLAELDGTPATGSPSLEVYDAAGSLVSQAPGTGTLEQVLPAGTYTVRVVRSLSAVAAAAPTRVPATERPHRAARAGTSQRAAEPPRIAASAPEADATVEGSGRAASAAGPARRPAALASAAGTVLYDQTDQLSAVVIISQNFTDPLGKWDAYDSTLADDFIVPPGEQWQVATIEVLGAFDPSPSFFQSVNVYYYDDAAGRPGPLRCRYDNLSATPNGGNLVVQAPCLLGEGHKWVSVQVNAQYRDGAGTVWRWQTRNAQENAPAQWRNPSNGWGTGCSDWAKMATCTASFNPGPDVAFRLTGTAATGRVYGMFLWLWQAPVPLDDSVIVPLDQTVEIPLRAVNRKGEPLSPEEYDAVVVTPPRLGTIVPDPINERVLYVPSQAGADEIHFRALLPNGHGTAAEGKISVLVRPRYKIRTIEPPAGVPVDGFRVNDVNENDHVVGELSSPGHVLTGGFFWRDGVYTSLQQFLPRGMGYSFLEAKGINDRDTVVGTVGAAGDPAHEFGVVAERGSDGGYSVFPVGHLGDVQPGRRFMGSARKINERNELVGQSFDGFNTLPVLLGKKEGRWHSAGTDLESWRQANTFLEILRGGTGRAEDVNDGGQVAGWTSLGSTVTAVRWDKLPNDQPARFLTPLVRDAAVVQAWGLSVRGDVVGESDGDPAVGRHAVLWPFQGPVEVLDLGALGSALKASVAHDLNGRLEIVGNSESAGEHEHAVLWSSGGVFDLNDAIEPGLGWELIEATAVNERGTIVGTGLLNNQWRGFLLTPDWDIRAQDETVYTSWNAPVDIELDVDPQDPALDFIVVDPPDRGTLTNVSGNRFRYVPETKEGPVGPAVADQFQFVVARGTSRSNVATVRIMEASYEIVEIAPPASLPAVTDITVTALNESGTVVGSVRAGSPSVQEGFTWQEAAGMSLIRNCTAGRFQPLDVNEADGMAGYVASPLRAAIADAAGCQVIDSTHEGQAGGLNDAGQAVGGLFAGAHQELRAFVWRQGGQPQLIPTTGGVINLAARITDDGWVVGNSQIGGGIMRGFVTHVDDSPLDLDTLGGERGSAVAVARADSPLEELFVAGTAMNSAGVTRPARWDDVLSQIGSDRFALPLDLGAFGLKEEQSGDALGVNGRGEVVGEFDADDGSRAFLWIENGFLLDLNRAVDERAGWERLERAVAINDRGWIAGQGVKSGETTPRAFLLKPASGGFDSPCLPAGSGTVTLAATSAARPCPVEVDLDVDSDNDNGAAPPDGSLREEQLEDDPTRSGKLVFVNNADRNGNGIPGYSDADPGDGLYVSLQLTVRTSARTVAEVQAIAIKLNYPGLAFLPSFEGAPLGGKGLMAYVSAKDRRAVLRIWKSGAAVRDPANYVEPGRLYPLSALGFDVQALAQSGEGTVLLSMEGVNPSSSLSLDNRVEAVAGNAEVVISDRARITVLEPTLGVNTSGLTPGVPDVEFAIDSSDALVKHQGDGFPFWFAPRQATAPSLLQKDDLLDLFPLKVTVPSDLVNEANLQLYWELSVEDGQGTETMAIYPGASEASRRRAFLQDDGVAVRQVQLIRDSRADDTYRSFLGPRALLTLPPVHPGDNEFLVAVDTARSDRPRKRMRLSLVAGPPGLFAANGGQVVDSVLLTLRAVEDHWTLVSARGGSSLEYDYPADRQLIPSSRYAAPGEQGDVPRPVGKKKFLIAVHGAFNTQEDAVQSFDQLYKRTFWLGFRGAFVGFSWDSFNLAPDPYAATAARAFQTSPAFLEFLKETVLTRWEAHAADVDVIGHSMGSLVVMDALRIGAYEKQASQGPTKLVHNVIELLPASWYEAYESEGDVTYTALDPITYTVPELERHSWHHWFARSGRPLWGDGGVLTGRVYHSYNVFDSVLETALFLDYSLRGPLPPAGFGWQHHERDRVLWGAFLGADPRIVRGPAWTYFDDGSQLRFVNGLGAVPSLVFERDNRKPPPYLVPDIGVPSGLSALPTADFNYDLNDALPGGQLMGHSDVIYRAFPEVYRAYEDFLGGRAFGGTSAIPLGKE